MATYQNGQNKNRHIKSEVKMYLVSEQEWNAIHPFYGRLLNTAQIWMSYFAKAMLGHADTDSLLILN